MCNRRGGGADHVKAVENGFGCSALFIDAERERRVLDFDVEVFGNLAFSDDRANAAPLRGVMPVFMGNRNRNSSASAISARACVMANLLASGAMMCPAHAERLAMVRFLIRLPSRTLSLSRIRAAIGREVDICGVSAVYRLPCAGCHRTLIMCNRHTPQSRMSRIDKNRNLVR